MGTQEIRHWQIGSVRVTRIVEISSFVDPPSNLFIEGSTDAVRRHEWLLPHYATPAGEIILAFQAFVVCSEGRKIMVDTCLGQDKTREYAVFENLQSSFLEDLAHAGAATAEIDTVLCTHLHHDHVGWNTRRVAGQWVPTFPNARYLFGRIEWEAWQQQVAAQTHLPPHLAESVQPLIDQGYVDLVEPGHRVTSEVWLEATPGHTPGHVSVHVESDGHRAVITGDVMHHPIQCAEPDWRTHFCSDHALAQRTRRAFLQKAADRKALVIGSHFAGPTAGWVVPQGDAWRFDESEAPA